MALCLNTVFTALAAVLKLNQQFANSLAPAWPDLVKLIPFVGQ